MLIGMGMDISYRSEGSIYNIPLLEKLIESLETKTKLETAHGRLTTRCILLCS